MKLIVRDDLSQYLVVLDVEKDIIQKRTFYYYNDKNNSLEKEIIFTEPIEYNKYLNLVRCIKLRESKCDHKLWAELIKKENINE